MAIPDNDPGGATSDIVVGDDLTIADVNVRVRLSHPRVSDLTLTLVGPDATEVVLSDQTGVSGANYTDAIFDDDAAAGIDTASAPYNGFYKPNAALTAFDGKSSAGTWQLKAVDAVTGETGTIQSWTINFSDCSNHILGGADILLPTDKNYMWEMPTQQEAATSAFAQSIPSATARVKVESWDPYGNHGEDISDANFYIVQPTTTSINTLVAWNSERICEKFDQAVPDPACDCASGATDPDCEYTYSLANKLIELKDHEKVSGVVLDLANATDPVSSESLSCFYDCWDTGGMDPSCDPLTCTGTNIERANSLSGAIRNYLMSQANGTYTNTQYLILVGDDHQIPFHRMVDGATIYPESEYPAEAGLSTATPVGYALGQGYFLTDNYYSELTPEASGMPAPHAWVYQNDFATGRLVETPEQIEGTVNTFLAQNGQVNAKPDPADPPKKNRVLVTGFDFLHDGAFKVAQDYDQGGYTPAEDLDTLLDDPGQSGDDYTPAMLEVQLFPTAVGENMHYISNINTHANHYSFAVPTPQTPAGQDRLYCTDPAYDLTHCYGNGLDANLKDLKSSVLYTSGCHSGLSVDNTGPDTKPLDLPEVMAKKGVVGYIGNTGYGWGLRNGRGLTETLMEKLTDAILDNKRIAIGKALAQAKRNYFLNEKRWDVFDEKVMHELTLFGIPNYLVVTGEESARMKDEGRRMKEGGTASLPPLPATGYQLPATGASGGGGLPLPNGPDHGCADGICVDKQLIKGGEGLRVPGGVMALDLNFTMCSGDCTPCPPPDCTYDLHHTPDGDYYSLNTRASAEVGDTLQPQFIFNAFLSDISAHGVLFTGGHYLTDPGAFDPVIAVPRSTNDDSDEGPLPSTGSWTPTLRVSFGMPSALGLRSEINEVGYTNMLVYTGMCEDYQVETCTQSRFKDMAFIIYYSNYADTTAPAFTAKGHTINGMTAVFTAEVTDASGVYRVLVTYRDMRNSRWSTLELEHTVGSEWTGTLELTGDTLYYWQAVDNAGNVGIPSVSGPDKAGPPYEPETAYGSTWSGPEAGQIVLPDGDTDGLPDAYEDLHACLDKAVHDSGEDPDYDELTSLEEFHLGTDPCLADTDGDGDNDGSEENNDKNPLASGDGDRLTLWPVKQAPADLLLKWYRGTDDGTPGGTPCDPGVSPPPCVAIADNDAIDGHFRVYVSTDARFSTNDHRVGPDGDLDDGAYDLDQADQREYLLVDATLPAEYQSAPILYFQALNWDILVNAPLVETVTRNGDNFTIYGQYFHLTEAEALLCEASDACDAPIEMTITYQSDERIQATAPGGVTGTKYIAVRNPDGLMDIYATPYVF